MMMRDYERFACETCPAMGSQEVEVNVPVSIRAHANVGAVRTQCLGPAMIRPNACPIGCPDAVCDFVISQRMKVDVPVNFGADTNVGMAGVNFETMPGLNGGPQPEMRGEFRQDFPCGWDDGHRCC